MIIRQQDDVGLNVRDEGAPDGAPVVFAHALGLDLHLWDAVLPHLPGGLRIVRLDMRGHGGSDVPAPPYSMGALVRDVEAICDTLDLSDCVVVGNSIGGMIAQGLAAKRLDLVRGLCLANTAPKIGTRAIWDERIAVVERDGMTALADVTMERWFSRSFRQAGRSEPWRNTLLSCDPAGYIGCASAIAGTDFYTTTAALRLPTMVTVGSEDGSTPPDLVREMAELIPGSEFHLLRGSGHLPAADQPEVFADILSGFLKRIGHV